MINEEINISTNVILGIDILVSISKYVPIGLLSNDNTLTRKIKLQRQVSDGSTVATLGINVYETICKYVPIGLLPDENKIAKEVKVGRLINEAIDRGFSINYRNATSILLEENYFYFNSHYEKFIHYLPFPKTRKNIRKNAETKKIRIKDFNHFITFLRLCLLYGSFQTVKWDLQNAYRSRFPQPTPLLRDDDW